MPHAILVIAYFLVFCLLVVRRPPNVPPLVWASLIVLLMLAFPLVLLRR